jgi:hypothetical protein
MEFVFDEAMIVRALEANGWRNVWDIYWVNDAAPAWGGLIAEEAFAVLLREKNLLQPAASPGHQPAGR